MVVIWLQFSRPTSVWEMRSPNRCMDKAAAVYAVDRARPGNGRAAAALQTAAPAPAQQPLRQRPQPRSRRPPPPRLLTARCCGTEEPAPPPKMLRYRPRCSATARQPGPGSAPPPSGREHRWLRRRFHDLGSLVRDEAAVPRYPERSIGGSRRTRRQREFHEILEQFKRGMIRTSTLTTTSLTTLGVRSRRWACSTRPSRSSRKPCGRPRGDSARPRHGNSVFREGQYPRVSLCCERRRESGRK